jgi:hypothetical protein
MKVGVSIFSLFGVVAALAVTMTSVTMRSAQGPAPPKNTAGYSSPPALNNQATAITPKENSDSKKSNFDKTRTDAVELSALADQLRDELKHMNINVLPLDVLEKTQKLEKLARKIKGEAYEIRE